LAVIGLLLPQGLLLNLGSKSYMKACWGTTIFVEPFYIVI